MIGFHGKPNNSVVQSYDEKYDQTRRRDGLPPSPRVYPSIDNIAFDITDTSPTARNGSPAGDTALMHYLLAATFWYSAHNNKLVPYHFSIHTWLETKLNTWKTSLSSRWTATQLFMFKSARRVSSKSAPYLFIRNRAGLESSLNTSHYILRSPFWRIYVIACYVIQD